MANNGDLFVLVLLAVFTFCLGDFIGRSITSNAYKYIDERIESHQAGCNK